MAREAGILFLTFSMDVTLSFVLIWRRSVAILVGVVANHGLGIFFPVFATDSAQNSPAEFTHQIGHAIG